MIKLYCERLIACKVQREGENLPTCECGAILCYFSGIEQIPEYLYCPNCNDKAFDFDGNVLFDLE